MATVPILQGLQPPTGVNLTSKRKAENWKAYKQRWTNYAIVTQLEKQSEEYRVALFLYCIGDEAVKIYNSFDIPEEDKKKLGAVLEAIDKYAQGETNETYERFIFNSRSQKEGEGIEKYVAALRTLAQTCNFCACLQDSPIRDRIVLGSRDDSTQKRLLQQPKLLLQKCIDICRSHEASNTQIKALNQDSKAKVDTVHEIKPRKG